MDASLCIVGAFQVQPRNRMAVEHSELMVVKLALLHLHGAICKQLLIKTVILFNRQHVEASNSWKLFTSCAFRRI